MDITAPVRWLARAPIRRMSRFLRHGAPLAVGLACVWLLWTKMSDVNTDAIWLAFESVSLGQWALAVLATAVSFWTLGRYDVLMHRHCKTGASDGRAAAAGMCGIAIGQTVGLAAVVGGLIRWKVLAPMPLRDVALVTASVSVFFLMSWLLCLGVAGLFPGAPVSHWGAIAGAAGLFGMLTLSIWRPALAQQRLPLPLPSALTILRMVGLCALDLTATALACFVLLPMTDWSMFATFLPAFLVAFGAGLYSGTPGGVGPFELALLAFLPAVAEAEVLASVIAFRIVYFALPTLLAMGWLLRDHVARSPARKAPPPETVNAAAKPFALSTAKRAELALMRQNGGVISSAAGTDWLRVDTGQSHICLFDPIKGCASVGLSALRRSAKRQGRFAFAYKVGTQTARTARELGWRVLRMSDDAIIEAPAFTAEGAARRQLRRKLRQAQNAGLTVRQIEYDAHSEPMARIAAEWRSAHGREKGISMGRYVPGAVRDQLIFGAFQDDCLVAFATFHETETEIALDLMRSAAHPPDGTMHSIILEAVAFAQSHHVNRVSLAGTPCAPAEGQTALHRLVLKYVFNASGGAGLRQFKLSFGPKLEPRYAAAPSTISLFVGLLDAARVITHPDRINPNG